MRLAREPGIFHDITWGSNAFNGFNGIPGYAATPGWDLATGWGTPDLGSLLWEMAALLGNRRDAGLLRVFLRSGEAVRILGSRAKPWARLFSILGHGAVHHPRRHRSYPFPKRKKTTTDLEILNAHGPALELCGLLSDSTGQSEDSSYFSARQSSAIHLETSSIEPVK